MNTDNQWQKHMMNTEDTTIKHVNIKKTYAKYAESKRYLLTLDAALILTLDTYLHMSDSKHTRSSLINTLIEEYIHKSI